MGVFFRTNSVADCLPYLSDDYLDNLTPVYIIKLHETIEHIAMAFKNRIQSRLGIIIWILDHKEWKYNKQDEHLFDRHLAIWIFMHSYLVFTDSDVIQNGHDTINSTIFIVFFKKSI